MSNIKITQLPELAPTPLSGSDVFPVVSSNVTYQVTANAIATFVGGGGANTGNVTFNDITIQGTGDEYGGSGLYLAPGTASTANLQYLRVRGGDFPTHIHVDTGNNQYFDQYFGADDKFVKLEANGNVLINASDLVGNAATWTFDIDGNVTVPGAIIGAFGNLHLQPDPANAGSYLDIFLTSGPDLHLVASQSANLILGQDNTSNIRTSWDGNVTVQSWNSNTGTAGGTWTFDGTGNLNVPQGGYIGAAGVKGDGTMLTGGTGNIASLTSFYADAPGIYAGCFTANPDGTVNISTYGNGTGLSGQWTFSNDNLQLPVHNGNTPAGESAQFVGTRKIINGALTGATAPYAVELAVGGTPTVVYTSSTGVQSAKVTFVTQSNGSAFQWEQFDVVAVPSGDVPGAVNFVVSNRVKATTTVPDTTVTATMNGAQIEITLTLSAAQTSGGWASFDATEFGLMVD